MSWSVVGHPPCPVGGAGPARELLARILDCEGEDLVWRFGLGPRGYALEVARVRRADSTRSFGSNGELTRWFFENTAGWPATPTGSTAPEAAP